MSSRDSLEQLTEQKMDISFVSGGGRVHDTVCG